MVQGQRAIQLVAGAELEGYAAEDRGRRARAFVADATRLRQARRARCVDEHEVSIRIGQGRCDFWRELGQRVELAGAEVEHFAGQRWVAELGTSGAMRALEQRD